MATAPTLDLEAIERDGFTVVRLLDDEGLAEAHRLYEQLGIDAADPYWVSSVQPDRRLARWVDQALKALIGPRIARLLPGYEPFLAAFIVKGAHGGEVEVHPDWTYTDERRHRARLFWCPLSDTTAANGTLRVLPGSHLLVTGLRGSGGGFPSPVDGYAPTALEHARPVALAAGEALAYDPALLHGSATNATDQPRPAAAIATAPVGAELVHFHRPPDGTPTGHHIDESHYTTLPYGSRPTDCPPVEPWAPVVDRLDPADLGIGTGPVA